MDRLIRADDTAVYGDKGYASGARRRAAEAAGVLWAVKEKAQTGRRLTVRQRASNRRFGKVCAKVEHVFRVLANLATARCAIAASQRTPRKCSRCWRSPISTSLAGHLRPREDKREKAPPRVTA
jgi:IS5 family transposase